MNPFFSPEPDYNFDVPREVFARFDQSEPIDPNPEVSNLITFSAVNLDGVSDEWPLQYQYHHGYGSRLEWGRYWSDCFNPDIPKEQLPSIFDQIPIYQYEIHLPPNHLSDEEFRQLTNPSEWLCITLDSGGPFSAKVYPNIFSNEPRVVSISIKPIDNRKLIYLLSISFDMPTWPRATEQEIIEALDIDDEAKFLAAFDVGQGAASALLNEDQIPFLYHDLGAGVTRNSATTPPNLSFCFKKDPPIVLSHWDMDHWAGARINTRALTKTWIVPEQNIDPIHSAFAHDILISGGKILVWPNGLGPITIKHGNIEYKFGRNPKNLKNRNGTGIVIQVTNTALDDNRDWLLMGDAGFHQTPFHPFNDVVAITVPHHGAKIAGKNKIPSGPNGNYGRLLFSFGPSNSHGPGVQHPVKLTIDEYHAENWDIGSWHRYASLGKTIAGGEILATAEHPHTHLGGLIAGWDSKPSVHHPPCHNCTCNAPITQA